MPFRENLTVPLEILSSNLMNYIALFKKCLETFILVAASNEKNLNDP